MIGRIGRKYRLRTYVCTACVEHKGYSCEIKTLVEPQLDLSPPDNCPWYGGEKHWKEVGVGND